MGVGDEGPPSESSGVALLSDSKTLSVLLIASVGPFSVSAIAPTLPGMASALGVSDARIGLVVTAITLPPIVLAPVLGTVGDVYGRRGVALVALFLFGAAGTAIPLAGNFTTILLLRAIQGIGIAGIAPIAITLLGDLYSGTTASTAQGFRVSTTALSGSLVAFVGGWLAGFGWAMPFFTYSLAFLVMAIVYVYVPETARRPGSGRSVATTLRNYGRLFREELDDPALLVLIVGGFVRFFVLFAVITFIPLFAVRLLEATAFEVGAVLAVRVCRIAIAPSAGMWIDRFSRKGSLLGGGVVMFATIALVPFVPNLAWLAVLIGLNAAGDAVFGAVLNDTVTARVRDTTRSSVVSVMGSLKESGKTAAPVALGIVLTIAGMEWVFLGAAVVLLGYILSVLAIPGIDDVSGG